MDIFQHKGQTFLININTPGPYLMTDLPHWDGFYEEFRTSLLARIARQSNHSSWACDYKDRRLENSCPIGIFRPLGELRLQLEALRLLLTGLELVIPGTEHSDSSLIAPALLSQLEWKTGSGEILLEGFL
jgi:hypothetical protein